MSVIASNYVICYLVVMQICTHLPTETTRLYPAQKHEKYTADLSEHENSGQLIDTAENCITFKHFY
jgi:hypothetical protein